MSDDALDLPDGLTLDNVDTFRRCRRDGTGELNRDAEKDAARAEVVRWFREYARRALAPGGAVDLRGARDQWKATEGSQLRVLHDVSPKYVACRDVLADVQEMNAHYGTDARVQDAVNADGRLDFDGDRWTVNTVTRPDGVTVVTLWHFGVHEQGRCVQGNQTWGAATIKALDSFATYRRLHVQAEDAVEEAGMHADVLDHALERHLRAAPEQTPAPERDALPAWEHVERRVEAIRATSQPPATRVFEEKHYLERVLEEHDTVRLYAPARVSSEHTFTTNRIKELLAGIEPRIDAAVLLQVYGAPDTTAEPATDETDGTESAEGAKSASKSASASDDAPVLLPAENKRAKWAPLAAFIDRALATTRGRGQLAEARRLWELLEASDDSAVLAFCKERGIDEDALTDLSAGRWSEVRTLGLDYRARPRE